MDKVAILMDKLATLHANAFDFLPIPAVRCPFGQVNSKEDQGNPRAAESSREKTMNCLVWALVTQGGLADSASPRGMAGTFSGFHRASGLLSP
ncbi:MAG: hypothetical protein ACREE6_02395 [Limisphaerales bacterium]